MTTTQTDLITALTDEHHEVEQIFSRLESLVDRARDAPSARGR